MQDVTTFLGSLQEETIYREQTVVKGRGRHELSLLSDRTSVFEMTRLELLSLPFVIWITIVTIGHMDHEAGKIVVVLLQYQSPKASSNVKM